MVSIEGRLPISLNKGQLIKLLEAELKKISNISFKKGIVELKPDFSEAVLNDLLIVGNNNNLTFKFQTTIPFLVKFGFIKFKTLNVSAVKVAFDGFDLSINQSIYQLSIVLEKFKLSGILGLFDRLISIKVNKLLSDTQDAFLLKLNESIKSIFCHVFNSSFNIKGLEFANAASATTLALRESTTSTNAINLDMFWSGYVENLKPGLTTGPIDIQRKEHPFEFNIAIHQVLLHEVTRIFIKDLTIPIINKKIPLQLDYINIDENVMHIGIQISEFLKGSWKLRLDLTVKNDTIHLALLQIDSQTSESLIHKGITKALEFAIEKLHKEYTEIRISVLKELISKQLKPSYYINIKESVFKVEVPDFDIRHIWLDQQSILINAAWKEQFYIEL